MRQRGDTLSLQAPQMLNLTSGPPLRRRQAHMIELMLVSMIIEACLFASLAGASFLRTAQSRGRAPTLLLFDPAGRS
jgi:hypothetical protein